VKSATSDAAGAFSLPDIPAAEMTLRGSLTASVSGLGTVHSRQAETVTAVAGGTLAQDARVPVSALAAAGAREYWETNAQAGATLDAAAVGAANGAAAPLAAPALEMLGPDGAVVAANDDYSGTVPSAWASVTAPATGRYVVAVRAEDAGTGGYRVGSRLDSTRSFRPYAGALVTGRVTRDSDATPVAGLAARLAPAGLPAVTSGSDADGRYAVPLLAAGAFTLEVLDGEGVVIGQTAGSTSAPGESAAADLVVPAHGNVTVTVRRGTSPVAGVDVTLESDHATALPADRTRVRTTDTAGQVVTSLPVGNVTASAVDVASGATVQAAGTLTEAAPLALEIVFTSGVRVAGVVRTGDNVQLLPGATVTLSGVGSTTAEAAGAYEFLGVAGGSYTLSASYQASYMTAPAVTSQTITVAATDLVANLGVPLPVLKGRVTEPGGVSGVMAVVSACNAPGVSQICITTTSAGDGFYIFYGLPGWTLGQLISVRGVLTDVSNLATNTQSFNHIGGTGTRTVNLTLPATGTVTGTVRDSAGAAVPGAQVDVWSQYG
jgi:hypothetical protein